MLRQDLYLNAATALRELSALRWVDWQKGQFAQAEHFPDLPLPAALLDIPHIDWRDGLMNEQIGELQLSLDLYLPAYGDTSSESETFGFFSLINACSEQLHTLSLQGLQGLRRTKETRLKLPEGHHVIAYQLLFSSTICEQLPATSNLQRHRLKHLVPHVQQWTTHP